MAACLLSLYAHAQDNYLSLSMGASLPTGSYSNESGTNTTGYAGTSFTLSFDGNYYLTPIFGFGGIANYGMNSVNEDLLRDDWIAHLEEVYPDVEVPPDANVEFTTTQWTYVNIMGGPTLGIPLERFRLEFRGRIGISIIKPPERNIRITYPNNEITSFASGQSVAFGYQLGTGIVFKPNESSGIRLGADYFSSESKIDVENRVDDDLGEPEIVTETISLPVSSIHLTLGLAYFF
mgnify:CR=1 FL=1